jgi:hypothetical protein
LTIEAELIDTTELHAWYGLVQNWLEASDATRRAYQEIDSRMRDRLLTDVRDLTGEPKRGPTFGQLVRARNASMDERQCRDAIDDFLLQGLQGEADR